METAGILALDLATWTGWALWRPGLDRPKSGVLRLPKTGEDIGRFIFSYANWLTPFLNLERPRFVVYEAPFVGERTSQEVARKLFALSARTEEACYRMKSDGADVRCVETYNQSVRSHFLGLNTRKKSARLPGEELRDTLKRLTVETCASKGWPVDDDNEADALAVLDFAAHTLRASIDVPWNCAPAGPDQLRMRGVA